MCKKSFFLAKKSGGAGAPATYYVPLPLPRFKNRWHSLVSPKSKGLFGLAYFRAYIKQLMQINKFLR